MSRRLGLTARLLLPATLFFVAAAAAGTLYASHRMGQEAMREARTVADILLQHNLATHRYLNTRLKPHVFALAEGLDAGPEFDPVWMSSTYAVREIDRYFQDGTTGSPRYYYKECAVNARSPANEADPLEREILERMKADGDLIEWAEKREIGGQQYYVYLLRGESMEAGCLRCHTDPWRAPAGLVETYGPQRSFGREAGELVSAISIRIPMGEALAASRDVVWDISGALALVLCLLGTAQWFSTKRAVVSPLRHLSEQAAAVATDPTQVGREVAGTSGSAEIISLAESLTKMSGSLHRYQEGLEDLVDARTRELERVNEVLKEEVCQRTAAEQAAKADRDKFLELFEQATDPILLLRVEADGPPTIVNINRAGLELNGFAKAELVGQPITRLDTPEAAGKVDDRVAAILERGAAEFAVEHIGRDGRQIHLEVRARRIEVEGVPHILSIERDVTERIELERRLRESQKLEAIGTLAGGIAHDFNNILGAVLGFTQLVKERAAPGSEDAEDLTEVLHAAGRARDLVKQILMFSRKAEEARKPVQLHLVVGEALRLLRQTISANIEIAQDLCAKRDTVLADATQLHQIVMNLSTNAYHAVRGDSGSVYVSLTTVEADLALCRTVTDLSEGLWVQLSVCDDGEGMTAETRARIFEPFYTTKPVGQGTGMGMAVVHGIVRSHGGAIAIDSHRGKGTRIDVYLPLYQGTEENDPASDSAAPRGSGRVLVVDDEPSLAKMTGKMLEGLGYEVETFCSSREALQSFREQPERFDLVLTDQTMPGLTGAALAKELLARRPALPVVICTGYSDSLDETSARSLGVRGLLHKPLDRGGLARALVDALRPGSGAPGAGG